MYGIFTIIYTVCLLSLFNLKIEWNSRGHILFDIRGIITENAILSTYQSNAKEMYVNLDAGKNSIRQKVLNPSTHDPQVLSKNRKIVLQSKMKKVGIELTTFQSPLERSNKLHHGGYM